MKPCFDSWNDLFNELFPLSRMPNSKLKDKIGHPLIIDELQEKIREAESDGEDETVKQCNARIMAELQLKEKHQINYEGIS